MANFIKKAGMEESGMTDPRTNLPIRVSTTARIKYREYFSKHSDKRDVMDDLSNRQLNEVIAQDFAASADSVKHMFLSNSSSLATRRRTWIEIRKIETRTAFHFFLSVIRPEAIDIIGTNTRYHVPRKPRVFVPKHREYSGGR